MPYIKHIQRDELDEGLPIENVGELTYLIQQLLNDYLGQNGLRYQQIAEILGALEGAKLDFIERVVKNYEQRKCAENGDVWPKEFTKVYGGWPGPERSQPSQETQDAWSRWRGLADTDSVISSTISSDWRDTDKEIERQLHYGRMLEETD